MYIRELPDPILTFELYTTFLDKAAEAKLQKRQLNAKDISGYISGLPMANRCLLKRILSLLDMVVKNEKHNKMTVSNLATIFGPNFLRRDDSATELNRELILKESPLINMVASALIQNYSLLLSDVALPSPYIGLVRAVFDYEAQSPGELDMKENDIVWLMDRDDSGWWKGEQKMVVGYFPSTWVNPCEWDEFKKVPTKPPPIDIDDDKIDEVGNLLRSLNPEYSNSSKNTANTTEHAETTPPESNHQTEEQASPDPAPEGISIADSSSEEEETQSYHNDAPLSPAMPSRSEQKPENSVAGDGAARETQKDEDVAVKETAQEDESVPVQKIVMPSPLVLELGTSRRIAAPSRPIPVKPTTPVPQPVKRRKMFFSQQRTGEAAIHVKEYDESAYKNEDEGDDIMETINFELSEIAIEMESVDAAIAEIENKGKKTESSDKLQDTSGIQIPARIDASQLAMIPVPMPIDISTIQVVSPNVALPPSIERPAHGIMDRPTVRISDIYVTKELPHLSVLGPPASPNNSPKTASPVGVMATSSLAIRAQKRDNRFSSLESKGDTLKRLEVKRMMMDKTAVDNRLAHSMALPRSSPRHGSPSPRHGAASPKHEHHNSSPRREHRSSKDRDRRSSKEREHRSSKERDYRSSKERDSSSRRDRESSSRRSGHSHSRRQTSSHSRSYSGSRSKKHRRETSKDQALKNELRRLEDQKRLLELQLQSKQTLGRLDLIASSGGIDIEAAKRAVLSRTSSSPMLAKPSDSSKRSGSHSRSKSKGEDYARMRKEVSAMASELEKASSHRKQLTDSTIALQKTIADLRYEILKKQV
eukprot:TRINITY_DN10445_c0_g1_i1.p1 TRINITY_DN10445_c0_g1~~TRINITY_DN10445_c0_g1_i1.p1  ORF type:complete len:841 (+),score=147.25 TRINITY_DN10445_c0_g1_i1:64-2523(+)